MRIQEFLERKLRRNTLQSSKQEGAKLKYITSLVLSSNRSAISILLLLSKLLVKRVRLIEGKATFETAATEMVQNQKKLQSDFSGY